MSLTVYDITIPVFQRGLKSLSHILEKGEEFAKEKGMPESDLTAARLAPDMRPLTFQIQIISNSIKMGVVRLTGAELPVMEDNETTFADLHARIATTQKILDGVKKESFDGVEGKDITFTLPSGEKKYKGLAYVETWMLPNFWFHLSTAYGILRSKGVPLGKRDFLSGQQ